MHPQNHVILPMMSQNYKEQFPNEDAVRRALEERWGDTTERIQQLHRDMNVKRYARILSLRGFLVIGMVVLGTVLLVGVLFGEEAGLFGSDESIKAFMIVLFSTIVFFGIWYVTLESLPDSSWYKKSLRRGTEYVELCNRQIFELVFNLYSLEYEKVEKGDVRDRIIHKYDMSSLKPSSTTTLLPDDLYRTSLNGRELLIAEASFVDGKKNNNVVYKGLFMTYEIGTDLEGTTIVNTGRSKQAFVHIPEGVTETSVFSESPQRTLLEWHTFNERIKVFTTDPVEARYVLRPNFMEDLYYWWIEKRNTILISFRNGSMYMIYVDEEVKIKSASDDADDSVLIHRPSTPTLQNYAMTLARPLMHILHLIEDVRVR